MADSDPIPDDRRCTATAKSTGDRCKQPAIPGGDVCRFHGGEADQVERKAQERLDEMADAVTADLQTRLDEVFEQLDDAEGQEYARLLSEVRKLTTDILDRTGHGPTEKRELENTGDEPLADVTIDFNDVDT